MSFEHVKFPNLFHFALDRSPQKPHVGATENLPKREIPDLAGIAYGHLMYNALEKIHRALLI